jgi:putative transferase (TIGR04331 family)
MGQIDKRHSFLAITALSEFWDTSKPILFLGPWCRRYSQIDRWRDLGDDVLASPWHDREMFRQAFAYLNQLNEKVYPVLGDYLNRIHGVNHSTRYWQILLGPWLIHYLHILFDRYTLIKSALEVAPVIETIGLPKEDFITPVSSEEFTNLTFEDLYNLQIFTRILEFFEIPLKYKKGKLKEPAEVSGPVLPNGIIQGFAEKLANAFDRILGNHSEVVLRNSYFAERKTIALFLKTWGKVWQVRRKGLVLRPVPLNPEMRLPFNKLQFINDEFGRLLQFMLPLDMPQCFIEQYASVRSDEKNWPCKPKAIFSAIGWYWDESFKHWAAKKGEEGTILIGAQHGGNYGSSQFMALVEHELQITDKYYSWGWRRSGCRAEVKSFLSNVLIGRKESSASIKSQEILLAPTAMPRYLYRFQHCLNYDFPEYLLWQKRFTQRLDLRQYLRVRIYMHDYGWDISQRWSKEFPEVRLEDSLKLRFAESLKNCRIFVCDNPSTTFFEALIANKPTILFWNPEINEVRQELEPIYDKLVQVGILHYCPEDAAQQINQVYYRVETWWNSQEIQQARTDFCDQLAKTDPDALSLWAKEFCQLANTPGRITVKVG